MSEINRIALFGKLNVLGYKTIESATMFCKLRGNPYVELVHWFSQILQQQDSDLHHILRSVSDRSGPAGQEHDGGAGPAPARRDVDLRSVLANRGGRRTRVGLRQLDVRRRQGAHGPPGRRAPSRRRCCATRCSQSRASSRRSGARPADRGVRRHRRRFAGGVAAQRWGRRAGAPGEASGAMAPAALGEDEALARVSPSTSPSARARGRSTRSPAATRRFDRSSTF